MIMSADCIYMSPNKKELQITVITSTGKPKRKH